MTISNEIIDCEDGPTLHVVRDPNSTMPLQVSAFIMSMHPHFRAVTEVYQLTPDLAAKMNGEIAVPANTAHLSRCCVSPLWRHDPAVATLETVINGLDDLGIGLVLEPRPYHGAKKADARKYMSWLTEHGFVTIDHGLMYRPARVVAAV